MVGVTDWESVRSDLLEAVFFNFTTEEVEGSSDLALDGYLDSLAIVSIVTIIDDHLGGEQAQSLAQRQDFQSLATIEQLFHRLTRPA
jgi:acyl carrier protein